MVYNWLKRAQLTLYPPYCALCDAPGHDELDLCAACRADLPRMGNACAACAAALPTDAVSLCPDCSRQRPPFDAAAAALPYEPPVDWLITRLKFRRHLSHARILGALLADRVADRPRPDYLLPVPLHPARYRERGFNQAAEIAAAVGRRLGVPVADSLARRIRATDHQADLPARKRYANVRGAFAADPAVAGLRLAIVDDVATTGYTVKALAYELGKAGAVHIQLWSAARA